VAAGGVLTHEGLTGAVLEVKDLVQQVVDVDVDVVSRHRGNLAHLADSFVVWKF
jgi:hypothetical protein